MPGVARAFAAQFLALVVWCVSPALAGFTASASTVDPPAPHADEPGESSDASTSERELPRVHQAPAAREFGFVTLRPAYVPPRDLLDFLGVRESAGRHFLEWELTDGVHRVDVRVNEAANLLFLSGAQADVSAVQELILAADVAPKQIEIEASIIEVSRRKLLDAGIDWDDLVHQSGFRVSYDHSRNDQSSKQKADDQPDRTTEQEATQERWAGALDLRLDQIVHLLDETGAGEVRSAPKILTVNNRHAQILDGQRVTYVNRYSSYTNLFETQTMDAGLTLKVRPSIGESGYLVLDIEAELTRLVDDISGSPIKDGQMVQNTVVVRDGQPVLLGGFERSSSASTHRRFPVLGHILPFLFSRKITVDDTIMSFVVLTPHVVDLNASLDPTIQQRLEVTE